MVRETRASQRRRAERNARPTTSQVGRITRLLLAARLEVAQMTPGDAPLRRKVCAELTAMIAELRATSVQVAQSVLHDSRPEET